MQKKKQTNKKHDFRFSLIFLCLLYEVGVSSCKKCHLLHKLSLYTNIFQHFVFFVRIMLNLVVVYRWHLAFFPGAAADEEILLLKQHRFRWMKLEVYVCMYVGMYVYICMYAFTIVCFYICMYVCVHV